MSCWDYKYLSNQIQETYQIDINSGNTPLESLTINGNEVKLKREDLNPNKSFKDRSLEFQLSKYLSNGLDKFVISSSGNAAVSAASVCQKADLELDIFVSVNIKESKFKRIQKYESGKIRVHKSKKAKSDAIKFASDNNVQNLRGSVDYNAVEGFKTISYELYEQDKEIDAIFICCSSGTSTQGVYEGYKDLNVKSPSIHIVQTEKIHPIAKEFDVDFEKQSYSIAKAISDRVAHRKSNIVDIVKSTNGSGWIVSDQEIIESYNLNIQDNPSPNSHVSVAGYLKSISKGYKFKNPCIIITGI